VTLIESQLLYQLSYAGAPVIVFAESSSACRRGQGRPPALLSKLLSNLKTVVKPENCCQTFGASKRTNCWSFGTSSLTPNYARARLDRDLHLHECGGSSEPLGTRPLAAGSFAEAPRFVG